MLPGKKYLPEDIVRIVIRRFWLLALPFAIIGAGTAVYARRMPNLYRSQAAIQVEPQRVPEQYVRSTVTTSIEDRLPSLTVQILSRTRLEQVIKDLNLYPVERATGIMEDIIEKMRSDIGNVQALRGDVFTVGFTSQDPRIAMRVAERLGQMFLEANLRDRAALAQGTDQFLESQVENARQRLIEVEKKVAEYKRIHGSELPDQLQANIQALANVQLQIQNLVQAIAREQDRRLALERQLADLGPEVGAPPPVIVGAPDAAGAGGPAAVPLTPEAVAASPGTAQQKLDAARAGLTLLLGKWRDAHPDVVRMKAAVSEWEKKADAEALLTPVSADAAPVSPAEALRRKTIAAIRNQLDQLEKAIKSGEEEEKRLRGQAAAYQQRIDAIPTRETEFVELTRDYAAVTASYNSLRAKKEDSKIAANLETREIGEQFRLLDPARIPARPFSPNREQITFMGMGAGLALGLLVVGLLEYRDATLKTDDEVKQVVGLPVLAVVPVMQSAQERKRTRNWRILLHLGAGSTVLGCLAVLAYTFVR